MFERAGRRKEEESRKKNENKELWGREEFERRF